MVDAQKDIGSFSRVVGWWYWEGTCHHHANCVFTVTRGGRPHRHADGISDVAKRRWTLLVVKMPSVESKRGELIYIITHSETGVDGGV